MKKYTIYAPGMENAAAFSMAFVLFDNYTVSREVGIRSANQVKFSVVTIFALEADEAKVTDLRDKFTAMADPATAIKEDITVL